MATVFTPKKQEKNIAPQFGTTPQTGVQSSAIQTGQQTQQPQKGSGSFTNIQKILGANVGAGQKMAERVGETALQQAQRIGGLQTKAQQEVGKGIEEERKLQSQAADIGKAVEATKSTQDINKLIEQQGVGLTGLTSSATNLGLSSDLLSKLQAQTGSELAKAKATQTGLGSEAGRQQLLQDIIRRPTYGAGMSALDQALMQLQGKKALQETGKTLGELTKTGEAKQKELSGLSTDISALTGSAQDIAKGLQERLKGATTRAEETLAQQAQQETEAAAKATNEAIERVKAGQGTKEDYNVLGLGKYYGQTLYNFLPSDLLSQGLLASTYSKQDIVKPEDIKAFSSLKDLLGAAPEYKEVTDKKAPITVSDVVKNQIETNLKNALSFDAARRAEIGTVSSQDPNIVTVGSVNGDGFGMAGGPIDIERLWNDKQINSLSMADAYKVKEYFEKKHPGSTMLSPDSALMQKISNFDKNINQILEDKYKATHIGKQFQQLPVTGGLKG